MFPVFFLSHKMKWIHGTVTMYSVRSIRFGCSMLCSHHRFKMKSPQLLCCNNFYSISSLFRNRSSHMNDLSNSNYSIFSYIFLNRPQIKVLLKKRCCKTAGMVRLNICVRKWAQLRLIIALVNRTEHSPTVALGNWLAKSFKVLTS